MTHIIMELPMKKLVQSKDIEKKYHSDTYFAHDYQYQIH